MFFKRVKRFWLVDCWTLRAFDLRVCWWWRGPAPPHGLIAPVWAWGYFCHNLSHLCLSLPPHSPPVTAWLRFLRKVLSQLLITAQRASQATQEQMVFVTKERDHLLDFGLRLSNPWIVSFGFLKNVAFKMLTEEESLTVVLLPSGRGNIVSAKTLKPCFPSLHFNVFPVFIRLLIRLIKELEFDSFHFFLAQ